MNIITEQSPHIRRKDSLSRMMVDVLIGLSPVIIFALCVYKWFAVRNLLVSVATMVFVEVIFQLIKTLIKHQKPQQILHASTFLVPTVSGVIYGLITPATYWKADYSGLNSTNAWTDGYAFLVLFVGALFGIVVGKIICSFFGGTGKNIFNPAATGFVFAKFVFGARYAVDKFSTSTFGFDLATGGTVLHNNATFASSSFYTGNGILDLLIGNTQGLMGETCKIAILIGLVYLLIRHTVDWRVVASFFGTFLFGLLFVGILAVNKNPEINYFYFILSQLLGGGVLFGGVYMITDPVTMPMNKPNRILYGSLLAMCVLFFRYLIAGGEHYIYEGMAFSILICNAAVPLLDHSGWTNGKFNIKEVIVLIAIPVVLLLAFTLAESGNLGFFGVKNSGSNSGSGSGSGSGIGSSGGGSVSAGGTKSA